MSASGGDIRKLTYDGGETVFNEGDPGDAMYIVESGSVAISKMVEGERIQLATLRDGGLFGEMAVIDGSRRMASAVAVEESVLIKVPRDLLDQKLSKVDPFLQALLKILIDNLRTVHQTYMRRPRSVDDYLNAITYHTDGFRTYLDTGAGAGLKEEVSERLEALDQAVGELRTLFQEHQDRRRNALSDSDLSN
jgi:CRP-like cAMP-binding protein